jgi:hypothetical protein
VYARDAAGQTLTLGVSGMLWNRSLVMYDRETNSLWSHILGEAMQGRLQGTRLQQVTSVMTDWQTWSTDHPDTTVLWISRTSTEYRREFYQRPEQFVLGIADAGKPKAWGFDELARTPVVNDQWKNRPVLVAFDRTSVTARLYDRMIDDRSLTFLAAEGNKIIDQETESTWEPTTGRAIAGPLAGRYLNPLPAIVSYKHVWFKFHPNSE